MNGQGKYSINNLDFLKLKFENYFSKELSNLILNFEYNNGLNLDLINYKKNQKSISNIYLDLKKTKDIIEIKKLSFEEKKYNKFK